MPSWRLFCRENEERTDGRVCHEELCFEVLNFDTHVSFEALHGALIESDQTAAGSVQIGDQGVVIGTRINVNQKRAVSVDPRVKTAIKETEIMRSHTSLSRT